MPAKVSNMAQPPSDERQTSPNKVNDILINFLVRICFSWRGFILLTVIFRYGDFGGRIGAKKRKGFFVIASGTYLMRAIGIYVYYTDFWCVIFVVSYICIEPS